MIAKIRISFEMTFFFCHSDDQREEESRIHPRLYSCNLSLSHERQLASNDKRSHQTAFRLPQCLILLLGKLFAVFQCFKQVLVFRGIKIEKDKTHY